MISKLSENGSAGFVLANGSMSTSTSGEGKIRQQILENDLVDCMIALPGQLFYTTQIPVCLWFLTRNKKQNTVRGFRNRQGETLFIDARNIGSMVDRTHIELTDDDIEHIGKTYHDWRSSLTPNPSPKEGVAKAMIGRLWVTEEPQQTVSCWGSCLTHNLHNLLLQHPLKEGS